MEIEMIVAGFLFVLGIGFFVYFIKNKHKISDEDFGSTSWLIVFLSLFFSVLFWGIAIGFVLLELFENLSFK